MSPDNSTVTPQGLVPMLLNTSPAYQSTISHATVGSTPSASLSRGAWPRVKGEVESDPDKFAARHGPDIARLARAIQVSNLIIVSDQSGSTNRRDAENHTFHAARHTAFGLLLLAATKAGCKVGVVSTFNVDNSLARQCQAVKDFVGQPSISTGSADSRSHVYVTHRPSDQLTELNKKVLFAKSKACVGGHEDVAAALKLAKTLVPQGKSGLIVTLTDLEFRDAADGAAAVNEFNARRAAGCDVVGLYLGQQSNGERLFGRRGISVSGVSQVPNALVELVGRRMPKSNAT